MDGICSNSPISDCEKFFFPFCGSENDHYISSCWLFQINQQISRSLHA
ncbi:hypothetical protein [Thermospira aquatica]|uniref:Kazal-like domain-containing protein n=1 Tax=Thermospira aquatica TaxID=2828656 RepID=A0AAX3BCH2_9SPIR|nr:hypothetical protein KDW03_10950 [Thermospira aquatica]